MALRTRVIVIGPSNRKTHFNTFNERYDIIVEVAETDTNISESKEVLTSRKDDMFLLEHKVITT